MKEILSPGEKVKKLRLELGLKQKQLTGDTVSATLISMIEKGERSVTLESAIIIANCLNKYYKHKNR